MVGWYHRLNGHEFEQTPGDDEDGKPGVAVKYDLETKKRQQASSQKSLNFSIILIHRK